MTIPIIVNLKVYEQEPIELNVLSNMSVHEVALSAPIQMVSGTPYGGSYEVTPTDEVQYLQTENLYMNSNVKINPIPSNYGLITWNGSNLLVS